MTGVPLSAPWSADTFVLGKDRKAAVRNAVTELLQEMKSVTTIIFWTLMDAMRTALRSRLDGHVQTACAIPRCVGRYIHTHMNRHIHVQIVSPC